MVLGAINHIAITVSKLEQALPFYQPVLTFLGYRNTENYPGVTIWESRTTGSAVNLWEAKPELASDLHKLHAPGIHHLAFNADSPEQIDEFYQLLLDIQAKILEPPAEYDYAPGYYAVFFTDPDGIKLELTHIPGFKAVKLKKRSVRSSKT